MFGGEASRSRSTWEWLPSGSSIWQKGEESIPGPGLESGCSVQISPHEILLIGGNRRSQQRLKFNMKTHKFEILNQSPQDACRFFSCINFKDEVIIAGGIDSDENFLASTELLNVKDLTSTFGTDMDLKEPRIGHGLVLVHYINQPTVLAIGGGYWEGRKLKLSDSIEIWHPTNKTWTLAPNLKLLQPRYSFGFFSVPTRLLCPQ